MYVTLTVKTIKTGKMFFSATLLKLYDLNEENYIAI